MKGLLPPKLSTPGKRKWPGNTSARGKLMFYELPRYSVAFRQTPYLETFPSFFWQKHFLGRTFSITITHIFLHINLNQTWLNNFQVKHTFDISCLQYIFPRSAQHGFTHAHKDVISIQSYLCFSHPPPLTTKLRPSYFLPPSQQLWLYVPLPYAREQ